VGLSPIDQITGQFGRVVVIDKIGNRDCLFWLTISGFIDRYTEAIAGLPSIFHIRILLGVANHSFAANALSVEFTVPPKKFPTVGSVLPMAES